MSTLSLPAQCIVASLRAGMMYFGLTASNKRVKWVERQWAFGEPAKVWPTSLPAAHMLPPCIVLWSRHMLPVRCPFLLRQLLKRRQRNPLSPCQRQLFSTIWQWLLIAVTTGSAVCIDYRPLVLQHHLLVVFAFNSEDKNVEMTVNLEFCHY